MTVNRKRHGLFLGLAWSLSAALVLLAAAEAQSVLAPVDMAGQHVTSYLAELADVRCTETVTQEKLTGNGHVEEKEQAKYDYLIMIDGNEDGLHFNESRLESSVAHHKQLPMLVTNGFSTMLLIFHPYYRDSFNFESGAEEVIGGKTAIPVHFSEIAGHRAPAALALRGRVYPINLKGTAWLDKQSGEVIKMDASLQDDMSDVGLRSLTVHVEYDPTALGNRPKMNLPTLAEVDVETPKQHWRNKHVFEGYKSFSVDAEQDPNVKVKASNPSPEQEKDIRAAAATPETKEQP
jgi:hypothetical protein